MAYSATLANSRKILSDTDHRRILDLFSRAGLAMDHPQFDTEILEKGTAAILKTRDGKLRAAVPSPTIGECVFLNDVDAKEMNAALLRHKKIMKQYPRQGEGIESFVDISDTGYTENNEEAEHALEDAAAKAGEMNGTIINGGSVPNGYVNGEKDLMEKLANGNGHAGLSNGMNGFVNGSRA